MLIWNKSVFFLKFIFKLFFIIIIIILVNGVPNTVFKFFSQKPPYHLTYTRKTGFGGTFSPISVILLGRLFPKTIGFTHEWTRISRYFVPKYR